ncbi:MAG: putative transposase [Spirosomataceae bacterium]|jgi:putative transposase
MVVESGRRAGTGNITDEMVNEYLEPHRKPNDNDNTNFIVE